MFRDQTGMQSPLPLPKRDNLGCALQTLDCNQSLACQYVRFHRKFSAAPLTSYVETPPSERGYLIGASMAGGHERRIFHKGQSSRHYFMEDAIYVRNFEDSYKAELNGSFDFVLMEIANTSLQQLLTDLDLKAKYHLGEVQAFHDPVIGSLLRAMQPMFERPGECGTLVLEQLSLTIAAHLFQRYAKHPQPAELRLGFLSKRQETLAKDMLDSRLTADVSIAEIAKQCGVSPGHFNRAFRASTGQSPHRWLTSRRLERARALLQATPLSLAEIAIDCGFTDQSHFTRVFSKVFGTPPGRWRRDAKF